MISYNKRLCDRSQRKSINCFREGNTQVEAQLLNEEESVYYSHSFFRVFQITVAVNSSASHSRGNVSPCCQCAFAPNSSSNEWAGCKEGSRKGRSSGSPVLQLNDIK